MSVDTAQAPGTRVPPKYAILPIYNLVSCIIKYDAWHRVKSKIGEEVNVKKIKLAIVLVALFVMSTTAWSENLMRDVIEGVEHHERREMNREEMRRECEECRHRERECWDRLKDYHSDRRKRICEDIKIECEDTCR